MTQQTLDFGGVRQTLVKQVEAFCDSHGISTREFGMLFSNDNKFYATLKRPSYGMTLSRIESVAVRANEYAAAAAAGSVAVG